MPKRVKGMGDNARGRQGRRTNRPQSMWWAGGGQLASIETMAESITSPISHISPNIKATVPRSWQNPNTIEAFFMGAGRDQSSQIGTIQSGAANETSGKAVCGTLIKPPHCVGCNCHSDTSCQPSNTGPTYTSDNVQSVISSGKTMSLTTSDAFSAAANEMPAQEHTAVPGVIPANPTNREIYELMTQTQINIMSQVNGFRVSAEERLNSLEAKASSALEATGILNSKTDTNSQNLSHIANRTKALESDNTKLNNMLKDALERLTEVESSVTDLDRENRRKNFRLINVPEDKDEDCILKVANMIKNNALGTQSQDLSLNDLVKSVENAHRIGKPMEGRNRHLLVKFQTGPFRDDLMRSHKSRGKKTREGFDLKDDMAKSDKKIHVRYAPLLKRIYDIDGSKVFFKHGNFRYKGVWYSESEFKTILQNYGIQVTNH